MIVFLNYRIRLICPSSINFTLYQLRQNAWKRVIGLCPKKQVLFLKLINKSLYVFCGWAELVVINWGDIGHV